jgi:hypothetical protein
MNEPDIIPPLQLDGLGIQKVTLACLGHRFNIQICEINDSLAYFHRRGINSLESVDFGSVRMVQRALEHRGSIIEWSALLDSFFDGESIAIRHQTRWPVWTYVFISGVANLPVFVQIMEDLLAKMDAKH